MKTIIEKCLKDNSDLAAKLISMENEILSVSKRILSCFERGGKLIFLGNGGSAVDSMHIVAEYVSRFYKMRKSLPAISLASNMAVVTAISNDYDFKDIFVRQLESSASVNDLVFSLTTSGESKNIIAAINYCKTNAIETVSFTGSSDNTVARISDYCIKIPSLFTPRIQESYMLFNHIMCEVVENEVINATSSKLLVNS